MISLTKIIDPLSGYIAKVQKDVSDRQRDRQTANPRLSGPATLLTAEEATKAAYVNRLTAEINEMRSGIQNMRDGLEALDTAEAAYEDVLYVLDKMQEKVSSAQTAEDLNEALSSDSTSLSAALNSYSAELTKIAASRQVNKQNIIDGTFSNKTFPMGSTQSNVPSISIENIEDTMASYRTFSALALAGDLNSNIDSTNIAVNKTIAITTSNGTNTLDQIAGESASSLAARINLMEETKATSIGVTAYARSTLRLNDLTNQGTLSLAIGTEKKGMNPQNIGSVVIEDKTNLAPLAAAINRFSDSTGVYANLGSSSNDLVLTDPNGGNISISGFTHSVSNSTLSVSVDRRDGVTDVSLDGETVNYNNVDSGFAGGSITFGMVGNLTAQSVNLGTHNVGSTAIGAVSIDASKNIFIGTGSGQLQIGTVDSSNNGIGGTSLQINFSSNSRVFANGTFDADSDWTKVSSQIISGTTQIDGLTTLRDTSFPTKNTQAAYGTLTVNSGTASGTLTINSGDSDDTLSAITINGINLISGTINYSDNNGTAAAIRTAINNRTGTTGYSAGGSGSQVTITTSTVPSDTNVSLTTSGTFNASASSLSASSLSAITVDGTNLISGTINYSDNNGTAAAIRTAINNRTGTTGYTATGSGAEVTINSPTAPSNTSINLTKSSSLNTTVSSLTSTVDTDRTSMTTGSLSTTIDDGNDNIGKMVATNVGSKVGYNVTKGMALQSANSVRLYENEQVSFRWRMDQTSGDKGDFQAYLVNIANNAFEEIKNTTANNSGGWQTETHTISTSGDYKLAFVSGSFDADGDGLSNVRVRVDNVEVAAVSDDVLDVIKNKVTYENLNFSASNASYTPQVSVTSVTGAGASTTETVDVPATLAGFSLTGGADQEVFSTGEVTILSGDSFSLTQEDNNTNGTTFWESSTATIENLELLSGSNPISANSALRIQNAAQRVSLAIANVTDAKDKNLSALRSQFNLGELDSSSYLDSLNITKAKLIEDTVIPNLTQKTAKMIIADEIQDLLAKAGNASADDVYALIRST